MTLGLKFDWDNIYKLNPVNYNSASTGNTVTYDSGFKYDQGHKYGAPSQPIIQTNVEGSGKSIGSFGKGMENVGTFRGLEWEYDREFRFT